MGFCSERFRQWWTL